MLHLVVALPAEARPLIDHFRLEAREGTAYPIHEGKGIRLVRTGIGKLRCAAACGYLQGWAEDPGATAWLNVGVAGHRSRDLGDLVLAHKISEAQTSRSWYPPLVFETTVDRAEVRSVDGPERAYPEDVVYEMEAVGFVSACVGRDTAELVQVAKIISDNATQSVDGVNPRRATELIETRLPEIATLVTELSHLATAIRERHADPVEFAAFLDRWHFTVTQRRLIRDLLRRWQLLAPEVSALAEVGECRDARAVMETLRDQMTAFHVGPS